MKKLFCIILTILFTASSAACSNEKNLPDEQQIKSICEFATLKCYYNNLAKTNIPTGTKISDWFEVERDYWIEYEGIAVLGIDLNRITVKTRDDKVTITSPHAEVLEIDFDYDSLREKRIVKNKDSWINPNKVTDKHQQDAIDKAQKEMEKTVNDNEILIKRAEDRAKVLIENYIKEIGKISGIKYEITWKFIE